MRRGVSISVLAVLLASSLAPLAQATAASLPVCCRVGGQHHCMGMSGLDGFHAAAANCPYRATPAVKTATAAIVPVNLRVSIVTAHSQLPISSASPAILTSFNDVPKRGPPAA